MSSQLGNADATVAVMGWALVVAPLMVGARRERRRQADAAEDRAHMDYHRRLRVAGEQQRDDPSTAETLRLYAQYGPRRATASGGRHRKPEPA